MVMWKVNGTSFQETFPPEDRRTQDYTDRNSR
jgi:hypothetical protein